MSLERGKNTFNGDSKPLATTFQLYVSHPSCPKAQKMWERAINRLLTGPSLYCARTTKGAGPLKLRQSVYFGSVLEQKWRRDSATYPILDITSAEKDFSSRLEASGHLKIIVTIRLETDDIQIRPVFTSAHEEITDEKLRLLPKKNTSGVFVTPWYYVLRERLKEFNETIGNNQIQSSLIKGQQLVAQFAFTSEEIIFGVPNLSSLFTFPFLLEQDASGLFGPSDSTMDILLRRFCAELNSTSSIKIYLQVFAADMPAIISYVNIPRTKPPRQDSYIVVPPTTDEDLVTFSKPEISSNE